MRHAAGDGREVHVARRAAEGVQDNEGVFERLVHGIELREKQACMLRGGNGNARCDRIDFIDGALWTCGSEGGIPAHR